MLSEILFVLCHRTRPITSSFRIGHNAQFLDSWFPVVVALRLHNSRFVSSTATGMRCCGSECHILLVIKMSRKDICVLSQIKIFIVGRKSLLCQTLASVSFFSFFFLRHIFNSIVLGMHELVSAYLKTFYQHLHRDNDWNRKKETQILCERV